MGAAEWFLTAALLVPHVVFLVLLLCQVGVLNWFARLWEIDEQEYWG